MNLIAALVLAHSWYSPNCCGEFDCHPIKSCDELIELNDGSVRWGDFIFREDRVHPSHDGHCHVCIHNTIGTAPQPMCVYILQGA